MYQSKSDLFGKNKLCESKEMEMLRLWYKKHLPLTLDVEVDHVGHPLADGVGRLAGVEPGVVGGEALEDEAPVAHDDPLPHILPQLRALEHEIVLLDNCRIMLHRIS